MEPSGLVTTLQQKLSKGVSGCAATLEYDSTLLTNTVYCEIESSILERADLNHLLGKSKAGPIRGED
tara:strand:- start:337 stop:537 length:201 start_codon:yes stop_codon:yes gene_type:complete